MKFIRQVLIPLIILLATALIIKISKNGMSENITPLHTCSNWGWDAKPNSDILFIGSSRTFRSVNLSEVQRGLQAAGHNIDNIEMIWTDFPNLLVKVWATEDYLSTGANPKIIILENSMAQKARDFRERKNNSTLTMLPVSQRYMPLTTQRKIQTHLDDQFNENWRKFLRAGYMNGLEFRIQQWRSSFYDFLDSPKYALSTRDEICPDVMASWDTKQTEDRGDYGDETISDELHPVMMNNVSNYVSYDPKAPERAYEVAMMTYLLDRLESKNPEKIYLWFPGHYGIDYNPALEPDFRELFPQIDDVIGAQVVESLQGFDKQTLFYNENHVNHKGRALITELWVEILDKDLTK